jgi:hypothetical protein
MIYRNEIKQFLPLPYEEVERKDLVGVLSVYQEYEKYMNEISVKDN